MSNQITMTLDQLNNLLIFKLWNEMIDLKPIFSKSEEIIDRLALRRLWGEKIFPFNSRDSRMEASEVLRKLFYVCTADMITVNSKNSCVYEINKRIRDNIYFESLTLNPPSFPGLKEVRITILPSVSAEWINYRRTVSINTEIRIKVVDISGDQLFNKLFTGAITTINQETVNIRFDQYAGFTIMDLFFDRVIKNDLNIRLFSDIDFRDKLSNCL